MPVQLTSLLRRCRLSLLLLVALATAQGAAPHALADEPARLLICAQRPNGHPPATHEYLAGAKIIAHLLRDTPRLETTIVSADEPWEDGPGLIDRADAVVLFLSQGAHWIHQDPRRLDALMRLAGRKGGFVGLHWGIGTREAADIEAFVRLVGGCHGGPDRKFAVVDTKLVPATPEHPVLRGVEAFDVHDELYYRLKFPAGAAVTPLFSARIEDADETVAWAWERPGGGRSCGLSGLHFHENWKHQGYRRLVAQSILWSLGREIPTAGIDAAVDASLLELR